MQRQNSFSKIFAVLSCQPEQEPSEEGVGLLDEDAQEREETAGHASSRTSISCPIDCIHYRNVPRNMCNVIPSTLKCNGEFTEEFTNEITSCSNVTCMCGLLGCTGGCMMLGLYGGCTGLLLLKPVIATLTPAYQAMTTMALPFGSMFSGFGVGALIWGKSTEAAQRWEAGRVQQEKSTSVCGFFGSFCEPSNEVPEQNSSGSRPTPLRMGEHG